MSSALISQKLAEAQLLLDQSHAEQNEGSSIAQQIAVLQREADRLLRSAREKRVIGSSQLEASRALAKEDADREAAEAAARGAVVTAAAPAKKRGGRPPKAAQAVAVPAPVPAAPATAVAAKKGPKAKAKAVKEAAAAPAAKESKAKEAKPKKEAKAPKKEAAKAKEPKAPKAPREKRATGEKGPPLHEKIKIVMGSKEMTIDDVIAALKAHDESWVPKSRDLNAYISLVLSTHLTDYFDRVKRGIYKVKKGAPATATAAASPKEAAAPEPKGPGLAKTNGKRGGGGHGPSNGASNGLEDFGTNVVESPFSGAEAAA